MSSSSADFAKAAVSALAEALEHEGLPASAQDLLSLLARAVEERAGTLTVTIATPSGHAGELVAAVKKAVEKKTGKQVQILERKDPSLLGGAIVTYGDERIDLSLRRSLEDAEHLLTSSH